MLKKIYFLLLFSSISLVSMEESQLHVAIWHENMQQCHQFIKDGANINAKNTSGKTAFEVALDKKNIPALHLLLLSGATYTPEQFKNSSTYFDFDAIQNNLFPNELTQDIILHNRSLEEQSIDTIKTKYSHEINALDHHQATPIFYAAAQGRAIIVEKLIAAGAKLDTINTFGDSLLSIVQRMLARKDLTPIQSNDYQKIAHLIANQQEIGDTEQNFSHLKALAKTQRKHQEFHNQPPPPQNSHRDSSQNPVPDQQTTHMPILSLKQGIIGTLTLAGFSYVIYRWNHPSICHYDIAMKLFISGDYAATYEYMEQNLEEFAYHELEAITYAADKALCADSLSGKDIVNLKAIILLHQQTAS